MKKLFLLAVIAFAAVGAMAQKPQVFSNGDGAIRGYDPVAYFTDNKPVKGDAKFTYQWNGATWRFASQANLEAFKNAPEKYAPQYGGYCAYGCSDGYKAPTEADAWTIVAGKLYLNYNTKVRGEWDKNRTERIQKADEAWPKIKEKG